LADVLPRYSLSATLVWNWILQKLAGLSTKAAAEKCGLSFALETLYRLGRKLRDNLARLRPLFCRKAPPPEIAGSDPMLQSMEHLQKLFPREGCPPALFQVTFQTAFLA
jgi:hypothetical protein